MKKHKIIKKYKNTKIVMKKKYKNYNDLTYSYMLQSTQEIEYCARFMY